MRVYIYIFVCPTWLLLNDVTHTYSSFEDALINVRIRTYILYIYIYDMYV